MGILVGRSSRVLVQGMTGGAGALHSRLMREYGTNVVAGVTPGKAGTVFEGMPVFGTVKAAVRETGADTSCIFVPPPFCADAIMEAADAGIKVIVAITEGIPVLDMLKAVPFVKSRGAMLVGPNCPGVITVGECKVGIMPAGIHTPGPVGVLSRSGTLTYEAVDQLTRLGIGQSTCIGIGGDPVIGTTFTDALAMFEADPGTKAVVLIGEIGGSAEEEAAAFARDRMTKPVVAYVAGVTAPPGKRMGHAGAVISGGRGTAADKIAFFEACGIRTARSPAGIGAALQSAI
jgi:succinyl-CoA synthetase alpha subunit